MMWVLPCFPVCVKILHRFRCCVVCIMYLFPVVFTGELAGFIPEVLLSARIPCAGQLFFQLLGRVCVPLCAANKVDLLFIEFHEKKTAKKLPKNKELYCLSVVLQR